MLPNAFNRNNLAGILGNALEWYDFLVYASLAPVLAELFFPNKDPFVALMLTFSVFAGGFFVRPLGGLMLGHMGDKLGRKRVLIISITTMALTSLGIGLLPTYAQIGIAAPLLIIVLRLLQGFVIGIELCTASCFLVENADSQYRGFAASLVMAGAHFGAFAGQLSAGIIAYPAIAQALGASAWRAPFLLGGILGLVGLRIRLRCDESKEFSQTRQTAEPLEKLAGHIGSLVQIVFLTSVMSVGNYFLLTYFSNFFAVTKHFPGYLASSMVALGTLVAVVTIPFFGLLSDRRGRYPIFVTALVVMLICAYPVFLLVASTNVAIATAGVVIFALMIAPIGALIPVMMTEIFPVGVRNRASGVSYNISLAIFGGTAPLVALGLRQWTKLDTAPAFYIMACAALSLMTMLTLRGRLTMVRLIRKAN